MAGTSVQGARVGSGIPRPFLYIYLALSRVTHWYLATMTIGTGTVEHQLYHKRRSLIRMIQVLFSIVDTRDVAVVSWHVVFGVTGPIHHQETRILGTRSQYNVQYIRNRIWVVKLSCRPQSS